MSRGRNPRGRDEEQTRGAHHSGQEVQNPVNLASSRSRVLPRRATAAEIAPAPSSPGLHPGGPTKVSQTRAAYAGVLLVSLVYFARPEDWIPGATVVPFAKVTGILALCMFALSWFNRSNISLPKPLVLLLLLLGQLSLASCFSSWKGGSFQLIAGNFSKIVLIVIVMVQVVNTLARLRRLMFLHAATIGLVALLSILGANRSSGGFGFQRLNGVLSGPFENPNDLALNLCLVVPLCFGFLFSRRGAIRRGFWILLLLILCYAVIASYSRGGLITLTLVSAVSLWFFGFKQKRRRLIFIVGLVALGLFLTSPVRYLERVQSIWEPKLDASGSYEVRRELLTSSFESAARHPLLGLGPGRFPESSGRWQLAHDSYTEIAAEAGLPALVLFAGLLVTTWLGALQVGRSKGIEPELRLFAMMLATGVAGLALGALFSSFEYQSFPYFYLGYAMVIGRLRGREAARRGMAEQRMQESGTNGFPRLRPGRSRLYGTVSQGRALAD